LRENYKKGRIRKDGGISKNQLELSRKTYFCLKLDVSSWGLCIFSPTSH